MPDSPSDYDLQQSSVPPASEINAAASSADALYINMTHTMLVEIGFRLTFLEVSNGVTAPRAAVLMSVSATRALVDSLGQMLKDLTSPTGRLDS